MALAKLLVVTLASPQGLFAGLTATLFLLIVFRVIYNLYFSPLAGYPGLKLWAATKISFNWHTLRGTSAVNFRRLHEEYGEVVRYAPDALAFTAPEAWDEIYGLYKGKKHMEMDPAIFGGGVTVTGAVQITNALDGEHRRLRMRLMRALSAKALAPQEHILQDYAHAFIDGTQKELQGNPGVFDMAKWFSIAIFDVIGDLALGKSFGGLKKGELHPWVTIVFGAFKALPYLRVLRELPGVLLIGNYARYLLPSSIKQKWLDHFNYASELLEKCFKNPKERPDFIYYLIDRSGKALTRDEIKENAAQMVTAGSEPTATFLAGLCYLLAHNPPVYKRLKDELNYLQAAIREGLRMFPPAADIFPRIIPKGGETIFGKYLPEGTRVGIGALAALYAQSNFHDPYVFDPERWLGGNTSMDTKLRASQPFGQGHRSCLGKVLAMAEIRLLLANLVSHFDMDILTEDKDWLDACRVFIGWEKIPLSIVEKAGELLGAPQNKAYPSETTLVTAFNTSLIEKMQMEVQVLEVPDDKFVPLRVVDILP